MDPRAFKSSIAKLAKAVESLEQIPVAQIALKVKTAAERTPHDTPLVVAHQIFSKMASTKLLISRAELNKIYNQIQTTSTELGDVLASELSRETGPTNVFYNRPQSESKPVDMKIAADPVLSNALSAVFAKEGYKTHSVKSGENAEKACSIALKVAGVPAKRIEVFAGNEAIIVCEASYETPRGYSSVLIPVEMKAEQALIPTTFIGQQGSTDITGNTVADHIRATAGKKMAVDGRKLVESLSNPSGMTKSANEVDLAVIKIRSQKSAPADIAGAILGVKMVEAGTLVEMPLANPQPEHFEFAKRVTNPEGAARFVLGDRVVEAGRDFITRKLSSFGHKLPQVKVISASENSIDYGVSLSSRHAFVVPMKVEKGNAIAPKVIIASGELREFSKEGVSQVISSVTPDKKVIAAVSACHDLSSNELVERVCIAMDQNNLKMAEDAIAVLGDKNPEAQRVAIAVVLKHLSAGATREDVELLKKTASDRSKQKVGSEMPYFMTSKVFFPEGV